MYNLRYHIASLVAVFLALAIGLLLGTVVAERGTIGDQSEALVKDLQQRFDEISTTNQELREGLERDREFAEELEPVVSSGVLAGEDVVVLVGTGRTDGLNPVTAAITDAGGSVFVASIEAPGLSLDEAVPEGLAAYFATRGEQIADLGPELTTQVAAALESEWRDAGPRPLTELLVKAGLLDLESGSDTATVDAVVIMAAADDGTDRLAIELGHAFEQAGGRAVGVDTVQLEEGVADDCAAEGLSAVGHVDTVQGRFSLVWVIAGRAEGIFGTMNGADAFYPPVAPGD